MHKRMPESIEGLEIDPAIKEKLPPAGTILYEGGEVAFPGVMDDWFNMLNLGQNTSARAPPIATAMTTIPALDGPIFMWAMMSPER